jgi:hypothetical protein
VASRLLKQPERKQQRVSRVGRVRFVGMSFLAPTPQILIFMNFDVFVYRYTYTVCNREVQQ